MIIHLNVYKYISCFTKCGLSLAARDLKKNIFWMIAHTVCKRSLTGCKIVQSLPHFNRNIYLVVQTIKFSYFEKKRLCFFSLFFFIFYLRSDTYEIEHKWENMFYIIFYMYIFLDYPNEYQHEVIQKCKTDALLRILI